jgi:hypothetical protein
MRRYVGGENGDFGRFSGFKPARTFLAVENALTRGTNKLENAAKQVRRRHLSAVVADKE